MKRCGSLALICAGALFAMLCGAARSSESTPQRVQRIVSINMCTDQLLLDLAEPAQIAGLSPFARDRKLSWLAVKADALPVLSGTAEEVMVLRPDLVVADRYTKSATRQFIRAQAIAMEEFDPVVTIKEARQQIIRMGALTGASERAKLRVAEIDSALVSLQAATASARLRVLPISRRGWVSGSKSLVSELLDVAGLGNAADDLGFQSGGFASLETIVQLRPDAILLTSDTSVSEDQGSALLLHPAIEKLFPPERRLVVPQQLTVCGGPMLAQAMRVLGDQISRIKPRDFILR
jgi:iron complex transport system substrate-binding protein